MATDDCVEIGRGPCPCGEGEIVAERCTPDHPWAKAHQVSYSYELTCLQCRQIYTFFGDQKARLVLKSDLAKRDDAYDAWRAAVREIEQSPEFKKLVEAVDERLAQERSAAARHRVLVGAGLSMGMPVERYRRDGFRLSPLNADRALALLCTKSPVLEAAVEEEKKLRDKTAWQPPGIKTGINGLTM